MSRSYHRRISLRLVLAIFSMLAWLILGILSSWITFSLFGSKILIDTIVYGISLGLGIGILVTGLALLVAWNTASRRVMLWMLGGSGIGGVIGLLLSLLLLGFTKGNTQADLVLPIGITIGAIAGSLVGVSIWRSR